MDEKVIQKQQAEHLAKEILTFSRNTLLVHLRFLDAALCKFVQTPVQITDTIATDGEHLYYNTVFWSGTDRAEKYWRGITSMRPCTAFSTIPLSIP